MAPFDAHPARIVDSPAIGPCPLGAKACTRIKVGRSNQRSDQ